MSIKSFNPKRGNRGFTLLELIVVIVILGILAALAIPTFKKVIETSELEVAEVTVASLVRETLALAAFDDNQLITNDTILKAAGDLPGQAYSPGEYAADTTDYQVVFGKWEFSGNERTISVIKGGTPVGSTLGVALYVPEIGCAFAKSEGRRVNAWSVAGLDPVFCNGAGAYVDPEDLLELTAPPVPAGLEVAFGCALPGGGEGWEITFDSGLADVFINGVFVGQVSSGACVPGKETDSVKVVVSDDSTPGWPGGIGDLYDDGSIGLPVDFETNPTPETPPVTVPVANVSAPVILDVPASVVVEWGTLPAESTGVIVSRRPAGSEVLWVPVTTVSFGQDTGPAFAYDAAPAGGWVYQVQPTRGGTTWGDTLPVTVGRTTTPAAVTSDGGSGSRPAAVLIGDSALIAWGAVVDTRNAPLSGYNVYGSHDGGAFILLGPTDKNDTNFNHGPLTAGTYCYRVSSHGLGGESAHSAESCLQVMPNWSTSSRVFPSSGTSGTFGLAVDIEGDYMVVGDYNVDARGAAYVFKRTGGSWNAGTKLTSPAYIGAQAGSSVAISGDTIAVGIPSYSDGGYAMGGVAIYTLSATTWSYKTLLRSSGIARDDNFGSSVALDAGTLAVGATGQDTKGNAAGAAYVFTGSGNSWSQRARLLATDGSAGAWMGSSIAIEGDTIAVGARFSTTDSIRSGAAYVFTGSGTSWEQQAKLLGSNRAATDHFGNSIAINNGTILVGAPKADTDTVDAGAAYVFTGSGTSWVEQARLVASDGNVSTSFGSSVAIEGNTLVTGGRVAIGSQIVPAGYVFDRHDSAWSQKTRLDTVASASLHSYIESPVAISGETIAVGGFRALKSDTQTSGAVQLFTP